MMKLVYVAGPFRANSAWGIEQNIRKAEALAFQVWQLGLACICPHANTRYFQGAAEDSVWLRGDLEILSRCDAVLLVPGWEHSRGSVAEVAFATERGVPVFSAMDALEMWHARLEEG